MPFITSFHPGLILQKILFFTLLLLFGLGCGVKGPPLPPLPSTPSEMERLESHPKPAPSPSSSPHSSLPSPSLESS